MKQSNKRQPSIALILLLLATNSMAQIADYTTTRRKETGHCPLFNHRGIFS
jgi:hypothetical protein